MDRPPPVIAIDTNLLVYARRGATPEHSAAIAALEQARRHPAGWGIPIPVIAEFWSVVTGPGAVPHPASPASAAAFLNDLWRAGALAWAPALEFERRLAAEAAARNVRGARMFDLQIGLIALEHGASELWTHDAGFLKISGLRIRDPLLPARR